MNRRNTPAKKMIMELLQAANSALSQERIEAEVKGVMDRVTIYRVLNRFCEDGVTHKILADDGKFYFALCHSCEEHNHAHDHFHFRCLGCEKVECLREQVTFTLPDGYRLQNSSSWITGYCKSCA